MAANIELPETMRALVLKDPSNGARCRDFPNSKTNGWQRNRPRPQRKRALLSSGYVPRQAPQLNPEAFDHRNLCHRSGRRARAGFDEVEAWRSGLHRHHSPLPRRRDRCLPGRNPPGLYCWFAEIDDGRLSRLDLCGILPYAAGESQLAR